MISLEDKRLIGVQITISCAERDISVNDLCKKAKVHNSFVSGMKKKEPISIKALRRLNEALKAHDSSREASGLTTENQQA